MVRRHRVTYANVVATVALVVALGSGTALAAVVVHSNADVAPNTIAGHRPPAGDHANLVAGSVVGQDLAANTVTGAKVDEKSLDPKVLQRRVIGLCIGGSAIQRVLENGTIRCGSPATAFDSENPEPNIALGASPVTVLSTDSAGGSDLGLQAPSRVFVHATVDVAHHISNSSAGLCVLNWSDGSSTVEFGSGGYWGDYLTGSNIFEVDDVEVALTGSVKLSSPGTYRLFVRCQVTDGDTTTTADNGDLTAIAVPA
jgi:hypothetical protein